MWRTLEPYHGLVSFTPHATEAYAALGITGRAGYFASRAAPMGAVPAGVVHATFSSFSPALVHGAVPAAWEAASPADLIAARLDAVDRALHDALGPDALGTADVAEAVRLIRRACDACTPEGRPLYAGHADLAWPDPPHLARWHGATLLREYRGDGHAAALVTEGLDGCEEALVTHAADVEAPVPSEVLRRTRGWDGGRLGGGRRPAPCPRPAGRRRSDHRCRQCGAGAHRADDRRARPGPLARHRRRRGPVAHHRPPLSKAIVTGGLLAGPPVREQVAATHWQASRRAATNCAFTGRRRGAG